MTLMSKAVDLYTSPQYGLWAFKLHTTRLQGYHFSASFDEEPSEPKRVGSSDAATTKALNGSKILCRRLRATHREYPAAARVSGLERWHINLSFAMDRHCVWLLTTAFSRNLTDIFNSLKSEQQLLQVSLPLLATLSSDASGYRISASGVTVVVYKATAHSDISWQMPKPGWQNSVERNK